jgi:hypothetical protein
MRLSGAVKVSGTLTKISDVLGSNYKQDLVGGVELPKTAMYSVAFLHMKLAAVSFVNGDLDTVEQKSSVNRSSTS